VRSYRTLGRTGLRISDISFGSSRLSSAEDVVLHALERGITYFDTAESYKGGRSETTIGRALRGKRDKVVIGSKVKCEADSGREALMLALEGSLRRLQTEFIDIYFNHAVNDVTRLQNDEWYEFIDRAREQGKVRFSGMSGHGGRLVECLDHALDHSLVDVILVAHNFGQDPAFYQRFLRRFDFVAIQPDLPRVLEKAKQKGVGVIAMKTLRGGRLNDLRSYEKGGTTFAQAAFRWVLASPNVDALVVSMTTAEQIDEYLGASGARALAPGDASLLDRYEQRNGKSHCRHGCEDCVESCAHSVPIPEVLRTRMYARDYGDLELAREDYARLGRGAADCVACTHRSCLDACPHGLEIAKLTAWTHSTLA
jgi:predicted aldo/keto reductase-like oxidoreductase